MSVIATTKMSSKGQVVIPEDIRNSLKLKAGVQFIVIGKGDSVILKTISPPSWEEFDSLMDKAKKEAKRIGLKKADITSAIAKSRGRLVPQ